MPRPWSTPPHRHGRTQAYTFSMMVVGATAVQHAFVVLAAWVDNSSTYHHNHTRHDRVPTPPLLSSPLRPPPPLPRRYSGIYLQRDGGRRDGCATFWRTSLLRPVLVRQVRLSFLLVACGGGASGSTSIGLFVKSAADNGHKPTQFGHSYSICLHLTWFWNPKHCPHRKWCHNLLLTCMQHLNFNPSAVSCWCIRFASVTTT